MAAISVKRSILKALKGSATRPSVQSSRTWEHGVPREDSRCSNPVEALIFFRLLLSNCLNWKIYCDDHSSLSSTTAVQNELFHILHHFTPHGRYELNKLTSLPMCGFIAQLVEQRTSNAEVTGSNPVEALIFFRLLLSNCLNWKIYCDDHSSLSSTTAVQNELFHILHHSRERLVFYTEIYRRLF